MRSEGTCNQVRGTFDLAILEGLLENPLYLSGLHEHGKIDEARTAVMFWLRRSADDSASEFHNGMMTLIQAYDPKSREGRLELPVFE